MSLELRILSGTRAGQRERFSKSVIAVGRHPLCDFRFDPTQELDVSARHAEIRVVDGQPVLHDIGSRNGTFVNGTRVVEGCVLHTGDVVSFGEFGPRVAVTVNPASDPTGGIPLAAPPSVPVGPSLPTAARATPGARVPVPSGSDTGERIAAAVGQHTRTLRRMLAALAALLVVGVAGAYWVGHREAREREAELARLSRVNDSLARSYADRVDSLSGRVEGLDSSLSQAKQQTDRLRSAISGTRSDARADTLSRELRALESRRHAMLTAAQVDYSAIARRNGPAVTLIAVQWGDGRAFSGSGFCITSTGRIITNRHLVNRDGGERPARIAVIFSDTKDWLPAHVVSVSDDADLALLQLDADGPFPAVSGVAPHAGDTSVGKAVAIIGYPLGTDTPMEGSGMKITARSTLVAGTVSKNLSTVVQIDAYAGEGSSGSPVFDTGGTVIGVVYGGARESAGRIVYAVPSDAVAALTRGE